MVRLNAYGQDFGESFGLSKAPALISRVLKKNEIAITEVGSDNPVARPTDRFVRQDAYLIGVQLRAFPHHEYWEDGRRAPVSDLPAGATTFYDLKRDPVALIDKPYHAIFFYVPRSTFNAIADDAGATRISELNYKPGAGVLDRTTLCLGQSMLSALEHPERASRLFVDHVSLAFAAYVAEKYGNLRPAAKIPAGGLAPRQVRRAQDILSANLDGQVALKEVAAECGLQREPGQTLTKMVSIPSRDSAGALKLQVTL